MKNKNFITFEAFKENNYGKLETKNETNLKRVMKVSK